MLGSESRLGGRTERRRHPELFAAPNSKTGSYAGGGMAFNDSERVLNFDKHVEGARRWMKRTEKRLLEYEVGQNVDFLCKKGAKREELLGRVSALVSYSPRIEPRRLDLRRA